MGSRVFVVPRIERLLAFVLLAPFLSGMQCPGQANTPPGNHDVPSIHSKTAASTQGSDAERWDVLPLAPNALKPRTPVFGEEASFSTFTRDLIQLRWRNNDPIDLYIIRPDNVPHPPLVLFLYSYPSDTDRFRNEAYCESIAKHGFAAVGFVSAMTGQRYHDRPMREWFVSNLPEALGASVHDVQMILNYLSTRGDLDMQRVGMYGQGSGGTIAILSASVDKRIKAVDVLDPWGDWPDWMAQSALIPDEERALYQTPAYLQSVSIFDPVRFLPILEPHSFRLQQTLFSQVTPEQARNRLRAAAPSDAQYVQYRDVDDYKARAAQDSKILDWLQTQLSGLQADSQPLHALR